MAKKSQSSPEPADRLGLAATPPDAARRTAPAPIFKSLGKSLIALSLIIVITMWATAGGAAALTGGVAEALKALGGLAALCSANLLMIQVFLMARIPVIERSFGQGELASTHRMVGFNSFNLLILHLVLTMLGLAMLSDQNYFAQLREVMTTYPNMGKALIALVLIIMVVVTSSKMDKGAIKYEKWHLLHLYTYLGIFLAIPHQLTNGTTLTSFGWASAYWFGLYFAALLAMLIWRVILPARQSMRHQLRVSEVIAENDNVTTIVMQGRHLEELKAEGGQFFNWRFLSKPNKLQGHPYSLSEAPRGDRLRISVKSLGEGSSKVATIPVGTRVYFEGPYGRLTQQVRTREKVTLMASGIGITVMRALMEELAYEPGDLTLIYRASTEKDFALKSEIDHLAQERGASVHYIVGGRNQERDSWLPASDEPNSDVETLQRLVPDVAEHDVYLCGPVAWMDAASAALKEAGVPAANIHTERFGW